MAVKKPKIIKGGISGATSRLETGAIREICLKAKKIMGTVNNWAANEGLISFQITPEILSAGFLLFVCLTEPKRMIPKVAAYDRWNEREESH